MRSASRVVLLVAAGALAVCGRPKTVLPLPTPAKEKRPVVSAPPVQTVPYDEGYRAGFELGVRDGAPKGAMPSEEQARRLAREKSSGQPERWERGFAAGYLDGFRNVVTGQK